MKNKNVRLNQLCVILILYQAAKQKQYGLLWSKLYEIYCLIYQP